QGRPAVPQSDVYAVGIVLYEMLTGTLPFDAENPLAVAMQQINQAPTRPTRLNAAIPPAVEAIVLKALAKNPAGRFAGAAEMKAAVDAARSGAAQPTRLTTRAVAAAPTATRHAIVAPPSATATTPPTATPPPPTATPRPTATRTPRATPTATSAPPTDTETPAPTATPTIPTATPTVAPSDTLTPATA